MKNIVRLAEGMNCKNNSILTSKCEAFDWKRLPDLSKVLSKNALDKVIITLLVHLTLSQLDYVINSLNEERSRRYSDAA